MEQLAITLPLLLVAVGFSTLWWDIQRRTLELKRNLPDPAEIEKFEIQRLAELGAAVNELQLSLSGVLDAVHSELEDARAERRKAQSKIAGSAPKTPRGGGGGEQIPLDQMDRATQLAAVEARYTH